MPIYTLHACLCGDWHAGTDRNMECTGVAWEIVVTDSWQTFAWSLSFCLHNCALVKFLLLNYLFPVCWVPCWWNHSACHLFTPGRCCVIPDSFPILGERKNIRYYTTLTHTFKEAYLASMVCHGQHDVSVSNGCCIRLGNKTEQTWALSDAMRAFNSHSLFLFPLLYRHRPRDENGWVNVSKVFIFTPK